MKILWRKDNLGEIGEIGVKQKALHCEGKGALDYKGVIEAQKRHMGCYRTIIFLLSMMLMPFTGTERRRPERS